MDKEGLQLAARFAWSAKKCAGQDNKYILENCVVNNEFDGVEAALKKYAGMLRYLTFIAESLHHLPFDLEVVTAYWLGSTDLKKIKQLNTIPFHLTKVLQEERVFAKRGKPDINRVTSCMVRPAEVITVTDDKLVVWSYSLTGTVGNYSLLNHQEEVPYHKGFLPGIKPGDQLAIHGQPVKKLTTEEAETLRRWIGTVLGRQH